MNHTLHIQLSGVEGSVIRALGLIERRGYSLENCTVSKADADGRRMEVSVSSSRPGDLLKRQLERLHDVFHVELKPAVKIHEQNQGIRPVTRRK
jgi:acetolactate synthase II small subunit